MDPTPCRIAYFSMEIGLQAEIPTYSGGLGVLAGDTIRSAADLRLPMVAVTLLHRRGYFDQHLSPDGRQTEQPTHWNVADVFHELPPRVTIDIEGRPVNLRAWRFQVRGHAGHIVPVYLLDSDLPENHEHDRRLTDHLYGGDHRYRLAQEALLGIGGVRMLRALGHHHVDRFHLNEGHASLLTFELLAEEARRHGGSPTGDDLEAVRRRCVFTTHTPVPAGHDKFDIDMVRQVIGDSPLLQFQDVFCCDGVLNMTRAALKLSRYVNAVAKRHADVSRQMFLPYSIDSITNGVHAATWVCPPMQTLFDQHIPGWREDNFALRCAAGLPSDEFWNAHHAAKRRLIEHVNRTSSAAFDADAFTIGYARRATAYKRPQLLISDPDRLRAIAGQHGPLQIIYSGKAHPRDQEGKDLIHRVHHVAASLRHDLKIIWLPGYDMRLAGMLTTGVDLWLNTPQPPMEASGTSGMKAALNGVPSLSTLDGWWLEGWVEGVTGWAIGHDPNGQALGQLLARNLAESGSHSPAARLAAAPFNSDAEPDPAADAASLYDQLQLVILPLFRNNREGYLDVMRNAVALNGAFFNTQRMVQEYVLKAYFT